MNMRKENHLEFLVLITWSVTSQLQFGGMFAKSEQTFPHLWYMLCFLLVSLIWAKPQRIIHTSGKAMNILKNTAYLHSSVDTAFLCENFLYEKLNFLYVKVWCWYLFQNFLHFFPTTLTGTFPVYFSVPSHTSFFLVLFVFSLLCQSFSSIFAISLRHHFLKPPLVISVLSFYSI